MKSIERSLVGETELNVTELNLNGVKCKRN